ncbi:polymer-forming cytoskeletal protein [Microbacteriaceae bacterium 4G12]
MKTERAEDLSINGSGTSNGGHFHYVGLNGAGTINGDVECVRFECNGSGRVKGSLKAETVMIKGSANIHGEVESSHVSISGGATIYGAANVKTIHISGKGSVEGSVRGEEISIHGKAVIEGDCEVEKFVSEGKFTVDGLLNADEIMIRIYGDCKAKEIGGQMITVKKKMSALGKLFKSWYDPKLEVELLEGDDIEIEYTKAAVVRGNNVVIGPDCEIGIVEYSGILKLDKRASVKESRKI